MQLGMGAALPATDCSSDLGSNRGKQFLLLISPANLTALCVKGVVRFCFCLESCTLQAQAQLNPAVSVSADRSGK